MTLYDAEATLPVEKVFRDPVHDYVHIQHQIILDLIDTKEFQRLRRIKQLGTSSFTFHGAEHSRFSHSLGVYEIARRICDKFVRNYPIEREGENGWDDSERLLTLCTALLHDVGHGPFSHTFENIFGTDHEQMTQEIILSPETEVNEVLRRVSDNFPERVAAVINKTYANPQVVQLVSSQIDADRMDYMRRDAYFTGVTYGDFDLTRIVRVMRPYKTGIVFRIQGKHAVEDYIVSRYQMHMQVYFHHVSRGMEVILDRLLARAKYLFLNDRLNVAEDFLGPFFKEFYTLKDYLRLDDGVLQAHFLQWSNHPDEILSDLSQRFLNRRPLKSVRFNPETDKDIIAYLRSLIEEAGYNPKYYTATNSSFDQPYDLYRPNTKDGGKTQIELIEKDGSLVELSEASDLVKALTGEIHGDQRFYVPREFFDDTTKTTIDLFQPLIAEFQRYIKNGTIIHPDNMKKK